MTRKDFLCAAMLAALPAGCQLAGQDAGTPLQNLLDELNRKSSVFTDDTVHVVSPVGPEDRYGGTNIESRYYDILRKPYPEGKSGGFYVSYRVQLEPGYTAYLLRVPSRYTSSRIDLWIYRETEQSWLPPVQVADAYGGGSWQYAMDGWLVDIDGDRHRDLVQRRRYWWTDDAFEEQQADSLFVRHWQHAAFAQPRPSDDPALSAAFLPARWSQ